MPRIYRDSAKLNCVQQRWKIAADNSHVGRATLSVNDFRANNFGDLACVLLKERRSGHAVRKSFQNKRTISHYRKDKGRDRSVVMKQITLGELLLWKEDLVEIGEIDCDP